MAKGLGQPLKEYFGLVPGHQAHYDRFDTRHKQIIYLHLCGHGTSQIADTLGLNASTVRRTITSDIGQSIINEYFKFLDLEFNSLYSASIEAVRDSLKPTQDPKIRLSAAELVLKSLGKMMPKKTESDDSAEDIVKRIIEMQVNTQINVYNSPGGQPNIAHQQSNIVHKQPNLKLVERAEQSDDEC